MSLLSDLNDKIKALTARVAEQFKTQQTAISNAQSTADDITSRAVVVDTVDQQVAGRKLFQYPFVQNLALTIGTNPADTQYSAIHWTDATGDSSASNRLATVEYAVDSNGTASLSLGPYQYVAGKTAYTGHLLRLQMAADGTKSSSIDSLTVTSYLAIPGGRIWIA